MEAQDIRWKQRFQNYEKAMLLLTNALAIERPDITQKAGIIQFFEISFELAWNTLKDYLEDQGHADIRSPRDAVKKAFEVGLIVNGHAWMQLIADRNLTTHAYDEEKVAEIEELIIHSYFPLFSDLQITLGTKLND